MNGVGDPVYGEVRRQQTRNLQCIGPIEPGTDASYTWKNAWYSHIIKVHGLVSVKVTFMDGSVETVTEPERIKAMLPPHSVPKGAA